MADPSDIETQLVLLATLRRRVEYNVQQQALLGATAPFALVEDLRVAREQIERIKFTLSGWGAAVEDHPADTAASTPAAAPPGQGFSALADLMRNPEVRQAVSSYQADFSGALEQIAVLTTYKNLHDLFQQLEDGYYIIYHSARTLPANEDAWDDLERNEPSLQLTIEALLALGTRGALAAENALWTQKLTRARQDLRAALEQMDAALLRNAIGKLRDVLGRELSRTNTRLVAAADAMHLDDLLRTLETVQHQLGSLAVDAGQLASFDDGLTALGGLATRLGMDVPLHRAFQDVDDELRRVEAQIEQDVAELADTWPDLAPMMLQICTQTDADWGPKLVTLSTELDAALGTGEPPRIRRAFRRYRSQASFSFNQVDQQLLKLCADLQTVGTPLTRVLRMIGA